MAAVVLAKILRAGEGKQVRRLSVDRRSHRDARGRLRRSHRRRAARADRHLQGAPRRRRDARRPAARGVRGGPRGRPAHAGPVPLQGAADGRCRPAPRQHRRDEDRRGQDTGLHPAGLSQRAVRRRRPRGHHQRLPGQPRRRLDGPGAPLPRPDRRQDPQRACRPRSAGRPTTATSPTAPTTSSASTTCATTWPGRSTTWCSAGTTSPSSTRSTRSSSTRPARR